MTAPDGTGLALADLTRMESKARLYARDIHLREGIADFAELLGAAAARHVHELALVMVKADGLAAGRVATILSFLAAHDLEPAALASPVLCRHGWRELWRYQLTAATLDRLALNDLIMPHEVLLLLVRDRTRNRLPASVRLCRLKGPSDLAAQPPDCLRRRLGQPNRILSFVHMADEPADVIRELAIILPSAERRTLIGQLAGPELPPAQQRRLEELQRQDGPWVDMADLSGAIDRVAGAIAAVSDPDRAAVRDGALQALSAAAAGAHLPWRDFAHALGRLGLACDLWDLARIGGALARHDEPGQVRLIGPVDPQLWDCPPGQLAAGASPAPPQAS